MAISDYKITAEDIAKYGCVSLPDTLTGDAQENKAKFDRLVRECVANAVNAVIDHMVLVENEAQDWASAEALRVQAEAARVAAENLRVQAENDRADAETARAAAETARVLAENLRAEAETARANAENKRDTAEKSRASAETGRVNAESARVTAESQRANAESVRAQNEATRISAETGRADAEADRVSAEDTRIANENARKSAETDRASAETVRESGENARKSAEKARASAEQQRESAESTRQTNETARVSAEKSRAAAETARQTAEKARNVWEEYSAGKAYVPGNKVSFNGSSYVCTAATTGHAPTDTAYWLLIAQKGADGKGAGDMLASVYDPKGKAQDVFAYTDQKIAAIPTPDVSGQIETHNSSSSAHSTLFAKKQDKIKGTKGKYLGFTATDTVGEVDAPASGGSRITLTFASDFVGQAWTLKGGGETYTGAVDSSLTATVSVLGINTSYTLSCVLDGVTYTTEVTTKAYYTALSVNLEKFQSTITVTVDSGSTVTATLGSTVLTKTSTGTAVFTVGKAGTWAIKATKGDQTAEGTVSITASGQSKSLTLSYANVFGVVWDTSNSSTALTRLTPETDPYGLVTKSVTTEPKPAVGTGSGSSPFDSYAPWSDMKECNLDASGTVTAWKGDSGFSRSNDYTMVFIPVFYVAQKRSGAKQYFYVSDKPKTGFTKHPGSGKYVGKYHMNYNGISARSTTGVIPYADVTRAKARNATKNNGSRYHLYDYATYCAIVFLYIVEFADWNCQTKIGRGYTDSHSAALNSGTTDSMTYHTGRASGPDGGATVQYRWIENLWGNVLQWVDGFNANGTTAYACTDPSKYADDTTTGYTNIGTLPASGYIKDLTVTDNGLLIPKTSGGSETTYVPDYVYSYSSGWRVLYVGGDWNDGAYAGLLYFDASGTSSRSGSVISARLLCEA
ncbi:hypothetical protein GT642_01365 [Butyricicoccus sp. BIOML-A1]|nr:hypothetical protein [Butyricicoccus sp. BIOML-A1]MZT25620.1 hypothetical protein [Butyricicoccus sp. BIOML-A1]